MPPKPLYYTFGNHMHWVDMQWLWGYQVLPDCIADQLALIQATGAAGGVNFDAIGYEKLAAEAPESLARLRQALDKGQAELVGGSYGQPYGLFQPGESNIRQFTYGVRAARRTTGHRPRTFWEEEFYFFPQLPQILRQCGYDAANLFFQWTWHTPELPRERASLIHWRGVDGTTIPALPRNGLNVHQWPEDFDGLLEQGLIDELDSPAIVQWLELMPTKDWMCRSELLLPRLKELFADDRFDLRPRTPGTLVKELAELQGDQTETREYHPDQIWHGVTLGKNADAHPRRSRQTEQIILAAEAVATIAAYAGRPYPSWDVYPAWELDEAWRHLLAAQHHDNHECEGLCGHVGHNQMDFAVALATEVLSRTLDQLERRMGGAALINPLAWTGRVPLEDPDGVRVAILPPCSVVGIDEVAVEDAPPPDTEVTEERIVLQRGALTATVDRPTGRVSSLKSGEAELLARPLGDFHCWIEGELWSVQPVDQGGLEPDLAPDSGECTLMSRIGPARGQSIGFWLSVKLAPEHPAMDLYPEIIDVFPRPDAGFEGALRLPIEPAFEIGEVRTNAPLSSHAVQGTGDVCRKYPTGDWMTSPQRFEHVRRAFTTHSWINLVNSDPNGPSLLVCHDGSQQAFRTDRGVELVITAYDPWDEGRYTPDLGGPALRVIPHRGLKDAECERHAREFETAHVCDRIELAEFDRPENARLAVGGGGAPEDAPVPTFLGGIGLNDCSGVLITAIHRANPKEGEHLPDHAIHRILDASAGAAGHPFVIRLVEFNGEPAEPTILIPGTVGAAYRTNLMGELTDGIGREPLRAAPADPPAWARGLPAITPGWSALTISMRPREITSLLIDIVEARKQPRDLDAKREVWATIHRTD
ncbi:MAG: hypothetical protein H6810_10930 [Phycisphaeraceae bacterium]|nr:MAG: hypothetical protein H6810_10930 [Phycisphaeraceae bacterium]